MTAIAVATVAEVAAAKRLGPFRIVKGHVEARVYRVLVLDMRRKVGDRQVYRASAAGWTKAERENAAAWIIEQCRAEGALQKYDIVRGHERVATVEAANAHEAIVDYRVAFGPSGNFVFVESASIKNLATGSVFEAREARS